MRGGMHPLRKTLSFAPLLLTASGAHAAGDSGGVSPYAYQLTEIYGLPITNSMVTSWVFSLAIILVFAGWPESRN